VGAARTNAAALMHAEEGPSRLTCRNLGPSLCLRGGVTPTGWSEVSKRCKSTVPS